MLLEIKLDFNPFLLLSEIVSCSLALVNSGHAIFLGIEWEKGIDHPSLADLDKRWHKPNKSIYLTTCKSICLYMTTWLSWSGLKMAQPCKSIYLTTCKYICLYTTPAWLVWTRDDTGLAKYSHCNLQKYLINIWPPQLGWSGLKMTRALQKYLPCNLQVFAYIWPPGLNWRWPNLAKESILQLANVFAYIWVWPPKLGCKIFTLQLGKVFAQHMTTPAWLVWTRDDTGLARTILSVSLCLASALCTVSGQCTVSTS